jgi:hypothetical protein
MTDTYFYLIGGALAVIYTHLTTPKNDYMELGFWIVLILYIFIYATSWFSLVISIAADVVSIKDKLKEDSE